MQLSRALAARGHDVTHAFAASIQTPRGALARRDEDPENFRVVGIGLSEPFQKQSFVKRRFQELEYGRIVAERAAEIRPDWVVSGNTPTEAQRLLHKRCTREGIRFGAWVQDFYGVAVQKLLAKRLPVLGHAIGGYYRWLDTRTLRTSDHIILITDDFRTLTDGMGVAAERVSVIENWAPLEELPIWPRHNAWSDEHGLSEKFVFLYSGTLGMKHDPGLLLELARHYRSDPEVEVVVISEGQGSQWLAAQKRELGLENLTLLPFQPFERMSEVLASAEVLMAILEPDAGIFSVPSKVLTYLCAGKPLLAAMPASNLATRIVTRHEAGLVVSPGDAAAFIEAAEKLRHNATLREDAARTGRAYAERTFDIDRITDEFERLLV